MTDTPFIVDPVPAKPIKAWTRGVPVETDAILQTRRIANMPFIHKHVALMPDVHVGIGATVGSVIPTKGAIIPAAVGVDLGCGMMAVRLTLTANDLPDSLGAVRSAIEAAVPHGRTDNGGTNDKGAWSEPRFPSALRGVWRELDTRYETICEKHPGAKARTTHRHLATLGTGNHFIELCLDEEDRVWVMLHSGSRGLGNRLGTYFIQAAQKDMERWFIQLPDRDLAYIPEGSDLFSDYIGAVDFAQEFAAINRAWMLYYVLGALEAHLPPFTFALEDQAVNCHHNYVARENHFGANVWVTRKGAVRAREGDLGIIPGSMGARSYIVRGKGNPQSFHSCSHGAGRTMSRTAARKRFSLADHADATAGVECRKDDGVLDETPGAYKDIDAVMAAQTDLVEIVHTLRQIVCVKG